MRYWVLLPAVAVLFVAPALGEPGNPIAVAATYHAHVVRGYTCGTWQVMTGSERTTYILGVIALADTLYASDRLDYPMDEAVRLPLSAAAYRPLVDAGCLYVPATTPVLAVLYAVK